MAIIIIEIKMMMAIGKEEGGEEEVAIEEIIRTAKGRKIGTIDTMEEAQIISIKRETINNLLTKRSR